MDIKAILSKMTLDDKISLCTGRTLMLQSRGSFVWRFILLKYKKAAVLMKMPMTGSLARLQSRVRAPVISIPSG